MGKSRDLFKKIRGIKVTFHAKMGTIKDRNGMDQTEAEDVKKRWQEYLRRNGVAIIVNKRVQNEVLGCGLKNHRMISVRFQANHSIS